MEAGLITELTNSALAIERIGIVGLLIAIVVGQFVLRFKDKKTQDILERQITALEKMTAVQEIHNGHMEKFMEEIVSKENLINERTFEMKILMEKG
jgi:uncharacterized membrane-anchored protein YhcB (DUF1043 family)